ncbi:MAG: Hemolysins-related protein [Fusobacteria bacterium]|nr:MAG: Hemolysins-related protein [Fusobacteriota bacterium]KAF0229085.1 MAG: Hemolysins-related protein [Fusobacteriota bacterium]
MEILLLILLIALNAFFAATEIALISLNDNKIKQMAEDGNKKAKNLVKLLGEPSRFLATIQIGITLAGFLASAFAAGSFAEPLVNFLKSFGIPIPIAVLTPIVVVIITMILAYFTLVLGELVPKRIAMNKSESISFAVVGPLMILSKLTFPFVKLLTISTNFFVRLLGVDPNSVDDDVTEEEIRMMVDVGEEKGTIDKQEKFMINNVFEFNNKTAGDIMTHRVELVAVPIETELPELVSIINQEHYTRIPVYEGNVDNIVGVLHVKDLLRLLDDGLSDSFDLVENIRKPLYIPILKKTNEIFVEMKLAQTHMAIVLDEYGGTAGIITIEDLLEEIVGNIFDEYDEEGDIELKKIAEDVYEASGLISLSELEGTLGIDLPIDDYDTLNGFLINLFGHLPTGKVGEAVKFGNVEFQVLKATYKRIERVKIHIYHDNIGINEFE